MSPPRLVSRLGLRWRSVAHELASSGGGGQRGVVGDVRQGAKPDRRWWWAALVLIAGISWTWALATPYFDGPDEGSHILRAYAVISGDFLPPSSPEQPGASPVEAPAPLAQGFYPGCLIGHYEATPNCVLNTNSNSRERVEAVTTAGRYPPLYYLLVGAPLRLLHGALPSVMLTRALSGLVCGFFLASAVASASQSRYRPWLLSGLLVAVTPQVIYTNAVVNPSALEISCAICLWTAGTVLSTAPRSPYDSALIRRMALAAIGLVSAKTSGPAFLLLIVSVLLVLTPRKKMIEIARQRQTIAWSALVGTAGVGAVLWIILARPNPVGGDALGPDFTTARIIRLSIGSWDAWARQMVGNFGWNDLPAPQFTFYIWLLLLGALLLGAAVTCRRRDGIVLFSVVSAVLVLPVVESTIIARSIGFFYQGRYTLPLATGVPIVAAIALAKRATGFPLTRRLLSVVAILAASAQFVSYVYAMHRYTVGQSGPLVFWTNPSWSPAFPPAILSLTILVLLALLVVLVANHGDVTPGARAGEGALDSPTSEEATSRQVDPSPRSPSGPGGRSGSRQPL